MTDTWMVLVSLLMIFSPTLHLAKSMSIILSQKIFFSCSCASSNLSKHSRNLMIRDGGCFLFFVTFEHWDMCQMYMLRSEHSQTYPFWQQNSVATDNSFRVGINCCHHHPGTKCFLPKIILHWSHSSDSTLQTTQSRPTLFSLHYIPHYTPYAYPMFSKFGETSRSALPKLKQFVLWITIKLKKINRMYIPLE